jgi:uncharacterized membrane protein YfhO
VDGRPAPILAADHALRAVYLPSGPHTARFTYDPVSFRLGVFATLFALLLVSILFLLETRNAKHNS